MLEAHERIFLYLRLLSDGRELARSQVRELAGLASAMADLTGELLGREEPLPPAEICFQYVEAETHRPLISMSTDWGRSEQVISGKIPPCYQKRMLEEPPQIDLERFEERAGKKLDPLRRYELSERLRTPHLDVLTLIRDNLREDGSFEVRVPLE